MRIVIAAILICLTAPGWAAAPPAPTLQFKNGNDANIPITLKMGEPAITRDTHRVFVGYSTGKVELLTSASGTIATTGEKLKPRVTSIGGGDYLLEWVVQ